LKSRSYTITAEVEVVNNGNGVIIAQAGKFGGWSLFMKGGKLFHEYNYFGLERTKIGSAKTITQGKHTIRYTFDIAEQKPGAGGKCVLYVDDQAVAEGQIPKTQPFLFSADEGVDVGMDGETAVSKDYKQGENHFNGTIIKITADNAPKKLASR